MCPTTSGSLCCSDSGVASGPVGHQGEGPQAGQRDPEGMAEPGGGGGVPGQVSERCSWSPPGKESLWCFDNHAHSRLGCHGPRARHAKPERSSWFRPSPSRGTRRLCDVLSPGHWARAAASQVGPVKSRPGWELQKALGRARGHLPERGTRAWVVA